MGTATTYEYRVAQSAAWRCLRCGEHMVSLWWEDATGHFADERVPLLCPRCARIRDFFRVIAELSDISRNTAEFMRLLAQLLQAVAD
jgi:hypothetical protein